MEHEKYISFSDQLRIEGINSLGYGILPKYVMLDTDLTIEAKTIYAYFCSYAGNGNTAFPSRNRIIFDLGINKDTYYKHFQFLLDQGYIIAEQSFDERSRFSHNVYTIVSNPKKFQENPIDKKHSAAYSRIRISGLKANGYGTVPKAVMIDSRLPLKSKGIYAYFCSFTGSGNNAFPKKTDILYHLGIAHSTYDKFYNLLIELNYITTIQRHIDGRLSVNDYYLIDTPDPAAIQIPRKKTSCESEQYTNFSDTVKSDTVKSDTEKQDTEKQDINKNKYIKNNSYKNQSLIQQENLKNYERMRDGEKEEFVFSVSEELLRQRKLPYSYHSDPIRMEIAIHFMTNWETFYPHGYQNELDQSVYNLFNIALIEMCTSDGTIKVKSTLINYSKVIDKINELAKFEPDYIDISDFLDPAMENFKKAAKDREIKNPIAYMMACIWEAMQIGNFNLYSALHRDGFY